MLCDPMLHPVEALKRWLLCSAGWYCCMPSGLVMPWRYAALLAGTAGWCWQPFSVNGCLAM